MLDYFSKILSQGPQSLDLILLCMLVGFVAAGALAIYDRRVLGAFIRTLIAKGALSKDSALTLSELGYQDNRVILRALRGKSIFAGTVYEASEDPEIDGENRSVPIYRTNFNKDTARFYIPEQLKYRAELRFRKGGTHIVILLIGTLLMLIFIGVILLYRETFTDLISRMYSAISGRK